MLGEHMNCNDERAASVYHSSRARREGDGKEIVLANVSAVLTNQDMG
jgi:hypothetical protein